MTTKPISPFRFWIFAFAYATATSLVLQKLVLPLLPTLHAGHGLLQGDAIYFHESAVSLAQKIQSQGWHVWSLFPGPALTGNVGLLAALYSLFGPDPALFIPISAAAHALGGALIYRLGPMFWTGKEGEVGGLVAGIFFVSFPSALQWYGQNHKDSFSIAGTLLVLYAVLRYGPSVATVYKEWLKGMGMACMGGLLIALVRPYFLVVVLAAVCLAVLVGVFMLARSSWKASLGFSAYGAMIVSVVLTMVLLTPHNRQAAGEIGDRGEKISHTMKGTLSDWEWQKTPWIPEAVDIRMGRLSLIRVGFIDYGFEVNAGSQIDTDRAPHNAIELIEYLPRAFLVGLLAPFPDTWGQRVTLPRLIGAIETCVFWLMCLGVCGVFASKGRRHNIAIGIAFTGSILTLLAYANPNVGTLYRQRYGVWFVWALLGCVGWAVLFRKLLGKLNRKDVDAVEASVAARRSLSQLILSSGLVIMITALTYVGFVVRDLALVKDFGLSGDLDGFFTAVMIPMFFITALAQPMADAMTPYFVPIAEAAAIRKRMIGSLLTFTAAIMALIGLALFVFAEPAIALMMGKRNDSLPSTALMLRLFIPILVFSSWTIIGNAILNALHRTSVVAIGQAIVPVVAVTCILVGGGWFGVYAAIYGMVLGFAGNLALIYCEARGQGIRLLPSSLDLELIEPVCRRYFRLCCITVLTSIAVPINYYFAGTLDHGGITTWAMGSKMVQVVTGLASISIGAVLLPHFSLLYSRKQVRNLSGDVYFSLVAGTWFSVIVSLIVHVFANPMAVAIFHGERVSIEEALEMASILRLGSLQLPFLVTTTLFVKFSAASGTTVRPILASALGVSLNVLLDILWADSFGVIGLTAATVVAAAVPASFLLWQMREVRGLGVGKVAGIVSAWFGLLLFTGAAYFSSQAVATAACLALLLSAILQWRALRDHASMVAPSA